MSGWGVVQGVCYRCYRHTGFVSTQDDDDPLSRIRPDSSSDIDPLEAVACIADAEDPFKTDWPGRDKNDWWVKASVDAVRDHDRHGPVDGIGIMRTNMKGRVTRYGSDCSGAESPFVALVRLQLYLLHAMHWVWRLGHVFGSEASGTSGTTGRVFMRLNYKPDHCFEDMCRRTDRGFCSWSQAEEAIEEVDFYVAGFVCKDLSLNNRTGRKPLDVVAFSAFWFALSLLVLIPVTHLIACVLHTKHDVLLCSACR